jgi:hypothetical protein
MSSKIGRRTKLEKNARGYGKEVMGVMRLV